MKSVLVQMGYLQDVGTGVVSVFSQEYYLVWTCVYFSLQWRLRRPTADADDAVKDHVCVVSEEVHLSDERAVSIELKYEEEEVCSVKMKYYVVVLSYF